MSDTSGDGIIIEEYIDPAEIETEDLEWQGVQQYDQDEWFNEYEPEEAAIPQFSVPDLTEDEALDQDAEIEDEELWEIEQLIREAEMGEEPIPAEWAYWENPELAAWDNTTGAPPESGDVDPDTGEVVP